MTFGSRSKLATAVHSFPVIAAHEDDGCLGSGVTMPLETEYFGFRGMSFTVGADALKRRQEHVECLHSRWYCEVLSRRARRRSYLSKADRTSKEYRISDPESANDKAMIAMRSEADQQFRRQTECCLFDFFQSFCCANNGNSSNCAAD